MQTLYHRSLRKQADEGQDTQFEQSFANIAHSFIQDRAPALVPYEVGFQLLERADDNTRAVGVFGFQVAKKWLYAPMFFLNGELKGQELLYLKEEDQFVPLRENWINYLLNKKPTILGQSQPRNFQALGVMRPHFSQLTRPPSKMASAMPGWVQEFLPVLGRLATFNALTEPKYQGMTTLTEFLTKSGAAAFGTFTDLWRVYPKLREPITAWYDRNTLLKVAEHYVLQEKNAASILRQSVPARSSSSQILTRLQAAVSPAKFAAKDYSCGGTLKVAVAMNDYDVTESKVVTAPRGSASGVLLSPEEKSVLMREKVLIEDKRDTNHVSVAYRADTPQQLSNPTHTGVYDVIMRPHKFVRCLVLQGPCDSVGRKSFSTLIQLDGAKKQWLNTNSSNIYCGGSLLRADFEAWVEDLPKAKDLPKGEPIVLIRPSGEATLPFIVRTTTSSPGGLEYYDVQWLSKCDWDRAGYLPSGEKGPKRPEWAPLNRNEKYDQRGYDDAYKEHIDPTVVLTSRGGKFRCHRGELFVPNDARVLKLHEPSEDADEHDETDHSRSYGGEEEMTMRPGNLADLHMDIFSKTAGMRVNLTPDAQIEINGWTMQPRQALAWLVARVGLTKKAAVQIIAEANRHKTQDYRVKLAEPYDLQQSAPSSPGMPELQSTTSPFDPTREAYMPQSEQIPIPDMQAPATDRGSKSQPDLPDPQIFQMVQQAAQTGQKDIFDTSILGGLLKATRDDNLIDRHMPDLMKGLDRIGRILFTSYWHHKKFQDRYGKEDANELEDGLRSAFESTGDVILFMRQKTVKPFADDLAGVVDLSRSQKDDG